jgi:hypothetical protein
VDRILHAARTHFQPFVCATARAAEVEAEAAVEADGREIAVGGTGDARGARQDLLAFLEQFR